MNNNRVISLVWFKENVSFQEQLDKANEVAIKIQSNHYTLFKAGKKLNQLKNLLEPPVKEIFDMS